MKGSCAVMFPGLGASYQGMMEKFVCAYPYAQPALADWSMLTHCDLLDVRPSDPREAERHLQLQIHALNLLWWRYAEADIKSPAVCGHSLGYYAAMVAAGVLSESDSLRMVDAVFNVAWKHFADSQDPIFVVTANEEYDFKRLVQETEVEVLSETSPLQRILHGSRSQYHEVVERMNGSLLGASEMGSRMPFHSKRMQAAHQEIREAINALAITPGPLRLELWSHITARPLRSSLDAIDLAASQPYQTVHWQLLVDRLLQAGRFDFIEVGPNRHLSQLVRLISPKLDVHFVDNLRH